MFDELSAKLDSAFARFRGRGILDEAMIAEGMREVRRALLEADVHFKVAKEFCARVEEKARGQEVAPSVTPAQQVIKIVHDELVELLGGAHAPLAEAKQPPTVIVLAGLQGSGKTTTAGKLARALQKRNRRPLLVDDDMMAELERVFAATDPDEALLVADGMTGQDAVRIAETFHARLPLTGVILTKLDGDARGGAALSIHAVTGLPIKYVGTGERLDALEAFHPDRMAGRILDRGDVVTLVERAQESIDEEEAARLEDKVGRRGQFDLDDFLVAM